MKGKLMRKLAGMGIVAFALVVSAGCEAGSGGPNFSESVWNPFGLKLPFATDEQPIRIGVVSAGDGMLAMRAWWGLIALTPWSELACDRA